MTDPYSIASLSLGLLGILIFVAYTIKKRKKPSLAKGLVIFLTSSAIPAGSKVCVLAFDTATIVNVSDNERLYICVGGLAVIWVSVDAVLGALGEK